MGAQELTYSSRFPIEAERLAAFGETPYFSLNPGHEVHLTGRKNGKPIELFLVPENEFSVLELNEQDHRQIPCRHVEEITKEGGTTTSVVRYLLSRDTLTNDLYLFGEDEGVPQNDGSVDFRVLWRAGTANATAGLWMSGNYLVGARYVQGTWAAQHTRLAENQEEALALNLPFGSLQDVVKIQTIRQAGLNRQAREWFFAPGIGLVAQDSDLKLETMRIGSRGIPKGAHFVPSSQHPYFPLVPGSTTRIEGIEDFLETIVETEVLDEVKQIELVQDGDPLLINARVVEEREFVNGDLFERGRNYYAQCLETGDVYILGEDVEIFLENGDVVVQGDTWLAGKDGAEAGIIMPGNLTIGATHLQENVPDISLNESKMLAASVTATVPLGTFNHCIQIVETSLFFADEEPGVKTYAPGIGLIDDEGILKLTSVSEGSPLSPPNLEIEKAVRLTWPTGPLSYRLESSSDSIDWRNADVEPRRTPDHFEAVFPSEGPHQFFRLVEE